MNDLLLVAGWTVSVLLLGAGFLHVAPRLGQPGRALAERLCRAPLLDGSITFFTIAPLVAGPIMRGWWGLLGAIIGQFIMVHVWTLLHELAHPAARRGPRITKVLNRIVGPGRNYAALWVTALVVPLFWLVRVGEVLVYPMLVWLVRFPKYSQGEWVNVSRQKFDGLVGHDLIWCLYCDWMTGVWSMGTEMLRNVEAFWCPIRFASEKKCEHCHHEFPDLDTHWISAGGSMEEVTALLEQEYGGQVNAWYSHPVRMTVEGKEASRTSESTPDS